MQEARRAVIVLDSNAEVLRLAMAYFTEASGVSLLVAHNFRKRICWPDIQREVDDGSAKPGLLFVDPTSRNGEDDNAGIYGVGLLSSFRQNMPGVKICIFTRSLSPTEIQVVIDRGLADHIEIKQTALMGSREYWRSLSDKVGRMVRGEFPGNVQIPSTVPAWQFFNVWINTLPNRGETLVPDLNGGTIKAGIILLEPDIFRRFSQSFMAGSFMSKMGEVITPVAPPNDMGQANPT